MVIREIAESDLQTILDMYGLQDMDDADVLSFEDAKSIWHRMDAYPFHKIFIALSDTMPVGSFTLTLIDNITKSGRKTALIENVIVVPEARSSGVGKGMMQFAMDRCKEMGCCKVVLSSSLKRTRAHEFYDRLGFERHGVSFRILWE